MRKRKNNQARTFQLPVDVLSALDLYAEKSLYSKSAIVEMALRKYLEENSVVLDDSIDNEE